MTVISSTTRLLVQTIALIAAAAILGGFVLTVAARDFFDELTQRLNRDIAMYVAQAGTLIDVNGVDHAQLARIARQAMMVNPLAEVYVVDVEGNVVGHRLDSPVVRHTVDIAAIQSLVRDPEALPVYGIDPRTVDQRRVFSAFELRNGDAVAGYVYVLLAGAGTEGLVATIANSHILRAASATFLALMLLAVVAAVVWSRGFTQPLRALHARVLSLNDAADKDDLRELASRAADLRAVSVAVESLAQRLRQQVARLEEVDVARREFLASIAHDLRTPLTAMRGSLDGMTANSAGAASMEDRQLLAIATRHCIRLGRLVEQIFALARLDSSHVRTQLERVSLAELAQDIVSKFQGLADAADLRLSLEIDPDAAPVMADVGLLETVLQNLLENAIRHTPRGGQVAVCVTDRGNRIATRVSDTGVGIGAEDLVRLGRPFEIGPGGRSGLGLTIVRRALELHGAALAIESVPGSGTAATFELPAAPAGASAASH
jgi:signal transduction histidine kinase